MFSWLGCRAVYCGGLCSRQIFLLRMYSMYVGQKVPYGRKVSEDWQALCQHAALLKQHAITPSETLTVPKTHVHKC